MNFWEAMLSFVFPPVCGICGKTNTTYICKECLKKLEKENKLLAKIDNYEKDAQKYISKHCYLFNYEGIIREKILQYKFNNKPYLANMFSEFFVKNEKICGFFKKYDIIISVPMSKKKVAQRGYNQSKIIAQKISKSLDIPLLERTLIKSKENRTQSTLNKAERLENVKNVYKIQMKQKIKAKKVLLFDDIYTTGSTVNECAKVLIEAGAKEVGVLTIAKDII